MNSNLENRKKLLILGAASLEVEVVRRAKQLGYYVIVTDYNKDYEVKAPAKLEADLAWDISWTDFDALEAACRAYGVSGVLAGFSEFRVEAQIRLCERLGLPCDTTLEQLEITRDKAKFKTLCRAHGVPVVEEFDKTDAVNNLPVIIKPTNWGGSFGIKVATRPEEFASALEYSRAASPSHQVIIEKFISGQTKVDAYYLVEDGMPYLMAISDTLILPPVKGHEICQGAWVLPSRNTGSWLRDVHPRIVDMIKSIKVKNGYITISAFACDDGSFKCFETGLRLSGELSYKFVEAAYGYSYLDFLIARAMGDPTPQRPGFPVETEVKMIIANFFARNGIVKAKKVPSENYVDRLAAASRVDSNESRYPYIGMYFSASTDPAELIEKVLKADRDVVLTDEEGHDMIAFRFDRNSLADLLIRNKREDLLP